MSRSRKKHAIYKDRGFMHDVYNRVFRRTNKQRLHSDRELKLLRELVNDYDICDWIYRDKDNPKLYRK